MDAKMKCILAIGSLFAATAAVSAHAEDQTAFFERQIQLTDGYTPGGSTDTAPAKQTGNTKADTQLHWLEEQMRLTDGYVPDATSVGEAYRPTVAKPKTPDHTSSAAEFVLTHGEAESVSIASADTTGNTTTP